MEMGSLAYQVRLAIKIIFVWILIGCGYLFIQSTHPNRNLIVNANHKGFEVIGSKLLYETKSFTGKTFELYVSGDTLAINQYVEGFEHGASYKFNNNGNKIESREYKYGKRVGIHMGWFDNGQLKFKYEYDNDLMHGKAEEWFSDGKKYREMNYRNGHENGMQHMWAEDGSVRANYEARNGRNYGLTGIKNCKNILEDAEI